jgi:hypothetical protein
MIDVALRSRLLALPGVTGIVGNQIKAQKGDVGTYPMITYWQVVAGVEETTPLVGASGVFRTIQQIEFYSTIRLELLNLMREARMGLDGFVNQTWGGVDIKASRFQDQSDREHQAGPDAYWSWQQYRIVWAD